MVADSMRLRYGADAALTNSGGLRADIRYNPVPPSPRGAGRDHLGRGLRGPALRQLDGRGGAHGRQPAAAFINGFTPFCDPTFAGGTGRFPQVSGLKVQFHCNGTTPVVDGMWKTPDGIGGTQIPIADGDSIRLVTNDFMYLTRPRWGQVLHPSCSRGQTSS